MIHIKKNTSNKDPRLNSSVLTPKSAIITATIVMIYSGILLSIYDNISFIPENEYYLVGSILALIIVASICIATVSTYVHYIKYTKPLLRIARAARAVSNGDYSIQVPPHRNDGKIDEIEALNIDFNNMIKDLSETEILKNNFISNISHELKTPIAIISNYSTLLEEDNLTEAEKLEYIKKIRSTSDDLSALISNILQISKLDNNQIEVNIEEFDLSEELVQCILGFEMIMDQKNLDLDLNYPEQLIIESDPGLLKIAINNILSNAIKFTPDNKKLTINLSADEKNDLVAISISDEGCGIPQDSIRYIFDKFYQADSSHATKGNGLGLVMVKKIVALLGGFIDVSSVVNEGSTFVITLPKSKS